MPMRSAPPPARLLVSLAGGAKTDGSVRLPAHASGLRLDSYSAFGIRAAIPTSSLRRQRAWMAHPCFVIRHWACLGARHWARSACQLMVTDCVSPLCCLRHPCRFTNLRLIVIGHALTWQGTPLHSVQPSLASEAYGHALVLIRIAPLHAC